MTGLFERVLGAAAFSTLPQRVQALHRGTGKRIYQGLARVEAGDGWLARLCARATLLPGTAQQVPVEVEIAPDARGERWTRRFGAHRMPSQFWSADGLLHECIGAATFGFALHVDAAALHWRVRRVRILGIPLPAALFGGVRAREFEADGRYGFDVEARLPLAGLLVHYRGWLDV